MVGALRFLPIFLIGFTSAQCPTPCSLYKVFNNGEMCGPPGGQFDCGGRWRLQSPNPHLRCNRIMSGRRVNVCLYRRLGDKKEYCFCDPGNSIYEPWPLSGPENPCNRNCTENLHVLFTFTLSQMFIDINSTRRIADGFNRSVLVYNGQLPGPTLTVCEGDNVHIKLINNLTGDDPKLLGPPGDDPRLPINSTTLHLHGIREKQKSSSYDGWSKEGPWSDGVPMVTQCPIPALDSFTYTFLGSGSIDAPYNNAPAGTYWYHSHVGRQRMNGASGKLIIMPRQKRSDVDIDVDDPDNSLFLQEWYTDTSTEERTSLLVNGRGKQPYYEVFNITEPGKRYRFRIIGGIGNNVPIRISIEDHNFIAISTDSIDIEPVYNLTALWITAGERYDIVIKTKTDPKVGDAYKINVFTIKEKLCSLAWLKYPQQVVDNTYEANCTEMVKENITKVLNPVPNKFSEWNDTSNKYIYPKDLRALVNPSNIESSLNTNQIVMSGSGTKFNDKHMKYPDVPFLFQSPSDNRSRCGVKCSPVNVSTELISAPCANYTPTINSSDKCEHVIHQPWSDEKGDKKQWFEIWLINSHNSSSQGDGVAHPIHHHGGWFNIVGMGQFDDTTNVCDIITKMEHKNKTHRNFDYPVFKDTIQVPTNGYVIFRAPIDNSGVWLVHCHIEGHFEEGMAMVIQIGEPDGSYPWSMGPNQKIAHWNENLDCSKREK